ADERNEHDRDDDADHEREPAARDRRGDDHRDDADHDREQPPHRIPPPMEEAPERSDDCADDDEPDPVHTYLPVLPSSEGERGRARTGYGAVSRRAAGSQRHTLPGVMRVPPIQRSTPRSSMRSDVP